MDLQSEAGDDRPPAYNLLSSTSLVPPPPQDSSSQHLAPFLHPVHTESRPLPPPPPPPPPPEVLRGTARPIQSPTGSYQTVTPTTAGGRSLPSSSAPSLSSRTSPRLTISTETNSETAARIAGQEALNAEETPPGQRAIEEIEQATQREREGRETRDRIQERLRVLLLQDSLSEDECRSVLLNCAEACAAKDVDFAALLQEPVLAGHLPVYWAIIKRPAAMRLQRRDEDDSRYEHNDDPDEPILAFFYFSQPLRSSTIVAARRACMEVSDNSLFRRLCRLFVEFAPVSGTDEMLLGSSGAKDRIVVEELHSNDGAFVARIKLVQFRLRMRLSKRVCVEFVTRDRMWRLTFSDNLSAGVDKSGMSSGSWPWLVTLQLGEHSAPTWVDAHLVITRKSPVSTGSEKFFSIYVPLKSQGRELQPRSSSQICASLNKAAMGTEVADGLSSFVDAFDVLSVRVEAKLIRHKPSETGCVVC